MGMVHIARRSGLRVYGAWPTDEPKAAVIWEAFKPETEPRRNIRREEIVIRQGNEDASTSGNAATRKPGARRSEEHTSELQSIMRISYAVFCLKKKNNTNNQHYFTQSTTKGTSAQYKQN